MNLFLYQGNNYYNRKIIHANSNDEYINRGFRQIASVNSVAFIVNDCITTSQVINYDHDANGFGDYVIVYDDSNTILSRWWVTKNAVVRKGQVLMQLLRDVISDWYDEILEAPSYIRKGAINSPNDPAIFNNENMSFNQIKTWEKPLKDKTACGWYVGYLSKDLKEDKNIIIEGVAPSIYDTYESKEDYPFYKYNSSKPFLGEFTEITHTFHGYDAPNSQFWFGWDNDGQPKNPTDKTGGGLFKWKIIDDGYLKITGIRERGVSINEIYVKPSDLWLRAGAINKWESMAQELGLANSQEKTGEIERENGKSLKIGNSYFKVVVNTTLINKTFSPENSSVYASKILEMVSDVDWIDSDPISIRGKVAEIIYTQKVITVSLEPIDISDLTFTIPADRRHTQGVPYDIFAIPAIGDARTNLTLGTPANTEMSQKAVSAIINALPTLQSGSSQLFDVQYLPYCPIPDDYINEYGYIKTSELIENKDYVLMRSSENASYFTFIIFATQAEFKKTITYNEIEIENNVLSYKVSNECDLYRLCSPNYNGQFEFSAAKNGGVNSWNVSFTCKPYNPYIKVAPNFLRLYGNDYGDARGLICGGDFSITQTNDAWAAYELQNKNFQNIFDRQIQNMEVNNSVQKTQEIVGAITGTATGAVSGAAAGSMVGGVPGAIIGGVVGGVASAAGGVADLALNERLRAEAISYAKDQFGYNLKNIKALPYSLTKVGTQNTDYKVWPFVEYYTCSDTEKQALMDKIEWNGYTIERIGTINAFLKPDSQTFIQAKIIRLDGVDAASNIVNVINTELQTGVYFT